MNFFRNPEIKRMEIFHLFLLIAVVAAGEAFGIFLTGSYEKAFSFAATAGITGILFLAAHYVSTFRRYQRIVKLSQELDVMLHSAHPVPFSDYSEGELSILQSELSKLTLRLVEQNEILEADKRYLSEAMADISHQLRTPLTASQIILSLLREPDLDIQRRRELLQEQANILSHMGWLIETLLKMAKMDANTAYFKKESVSVKKLLDCALETFLIPLEIRGQQLFIEGVTEDMVFEGDFSWLCEAVQNLVKNCMEHIASGGALWIKCKKTPLYTEIVIEDNGTGFCEEDIPHLFERFYKGQNSTEQSVGIGLALTRMILAEQNGTIKAENRKEGGARFVVRIMEKIGNCEK